MNKFKVGDEVVFNPQSWSIPGESPFNVKVTETNEEWFSGVVCVAGGRQKIGQKRDGMGYQYFEKAPAKPLPFRDRHGRFAKPIEFTLYKRHVVSVPVTVIAANFGEAETRVMAGEGEGDMSKAIPAKLTDAEYVFPLEATWNEKPLAKSK